MAFNRHGGFQGQRKESRMKRGLLAAALLGLATSAFAQAQPQEPPSAASCKAEEAALERDIDLARSRGQMLRRRQLAENLSALRTRCEASDPSMSRAARIDKLERDIQLLKAELEQAEEQLRELRNERP
jgi:septal ring factor EnvC (AmiA/AmiB activator)